MVCCLFLVTILGFNRPQLLLKYLVCLQSHYFTSVYFSRNLIHHTCIPAIQPLYYMSCTAMLPFYTLHKCSPSPIAALTWVVLSNQSGVDTPLYNWCAVTLDGHCLQLSIHQWEFWHITCMLFFTVTDIFAFCFHVKQEAPYQAIGISCTCGVSWFRNKKPCQNIRVMSDWLTIKGDKRIKSVGGKNGREGKNPAKCFVFYREKEISNSLHKISMHHMAFKFLCMFVWHLWTI